MAEDNRRVLSNFFSLSMLQAANYLLPLITLPYLVRVLGIEYFGLLAFATATVTYFSVISDYGFNLSATKEISIHKDNREKIVEIFSSVMSIKILLMFLSFFLMNILIFSFERFSQNWQIYYYTFGMVVGQVLFPIWFFQGMQRMKYITYLNILSKSIFTIALFIFIHKQSDFYIVPILTSIGFIVAGIYSLFIVKRDFDISFKLQKLGTIKRYLVDGWHIFLSRIYVSLYTTINIFILGIFTNNTVVGHYSIAEKIINAVGGFFTPANQAIYPYMASLYKKNKLKFKNFTVQMSYIYLVISFMLFTLMYLFGENIIFLITGANNTNIEPIYFILLFSIILAPFGAFFTQILIIQKQNQAFNRILRNTFLLTIILAPVMIYLLGGVGLAIVVIISKIFVISLCYGQIKKIKYQGIL